MVQVARKRSKEDVQQLKDLMLEGWTIKIDGRGLLSYGRDSYRNVGSGQGDTMLGNNPKDFHQAIQELEKEGYDVRHKSCQGSGCCQYAATAYWLEMVEETTVKKTNKTKKGPKQIDLGKEFKLLFEVNTEIMHNIIFAGATGLRYQIEINKDTQVNTSTGLYIMQSGGLFELAANYAEVGLLGEQDDEQVIKAYVNYVKAVYEEDDAE